MASGISTKGRYALRVMADMALSQKECEWVALGDVAQRQGISRKYLEQVMASLHKAGFVVSQRGKGGGYRLARQPEDYTLGEIIRMAEGSSLAPVSCLDCTTGALCPRAKACPTQPVWAELSALISGYLNSKHLSDIIEGLDSPSQTAQAFEGLDSLCN